ncbi:uncharacterized protein LOC100209854 [Hydra vulgaris]|uniref:uncharacterized protein LOC100209854 n=1 Tax=Hydra vulgaris TaxID=6087 RepID=UPI001F5F0182|nr:uncharacterized protein LOC100209854 [Hydra vulgaris]
MNQRLGFQNVINGRNNHYRLGVRKPEVSRNIPSAFFGLVATGLYIVSMAEPNWFRLEGALCSTEHLGLYIIFGSQSKHSDGCWNVSIVEKLQICAGLSFLAIISSVLQFTLDLCGTSNRGLLFVWNNSLGNITSVLLSISIMCICYWISVDANNLKVTKVTCFLDIGFYLIAAAGIAAFIGCILNLLKITCEKIVFPVQSNDNELQLQLIHDDNEIEEFPPVFPPVYCP